MFSQGQAEAYSSLLQGGLRTLLEDVQHQRLGMKSLDLCKGHPGFRLSTPLRKSLTPSSRYKNPRKLPHFPYHETDCPLPKQFNIHVLKKNPSTPIVSVILSISNFNRTERFRERYSTYTYFCGTPFHINDDTRVYACPLNVVTWAAFLQSKSTFRYVINTETKHRYKETHFKAETD